MPARLNGFLVIDKPAKLTSAQVVARVKRLTGAQRVGHSGTLDPFATGVLICCLNQATRLAGFLLKDSKRYRAVLHLGVETDTQDGTGEAVSKEAVSKEVVSSVRVNHLSPEKIHAAFSAFKGTFNQQPPTYSALKHQGVPLYKLARMGRPVQKPPREVTVSRLVIEKIALPEVTFEVTCSAGTYIRTLGADIGRRLGCGGHLTALRRLNSGPFGVDAALGLDQLETAAADGRVAELIIQPARALAHWPHVVADKRLLGKIRYGQRLSLADVDALQSADQRPTGPILVLGPEDRLVAVVEYQAESSRLNYHCVFTDEIIASGIV
jgi:tRNA pseudouridine55 synthase